MTRRRRWGASTSRQETVRKGRRRGLRECAGIGRVLYNDVNIVWNLRRQDHVEIEHTYNLGGAKL